MVSPQPASVRLRMQQLDLLFSVAGDLDARALSWSAPSLLPSISSSSTRRVA